MASCTSTSGPPSAQDAGAARHDASLAPADADADGRFESIDADMDAARSFADAGGTREDSGRDAGVVIDCGVAMCPRPTLAQQAYVKASNNGAQHNFGSAVALSADGTTMAIGAFFEGSDARGIDGDQANERAPHSGAVYVFRRTGGHWAQEAYIKASNTDAEDYFGGAVALSSDGSTLAVGASGEASAATGIGGDQTSDEKAVSGAVYVFRRTGTTWTQEAYVKASNTNARDVFGWAVALSGDGATLAVSAYWEDSSATGVGGDQVDNRMEDSGAVYVFRRGAMSWTQEAYVKASNPDVLDQFGSALALSRDGSTLAVGAVWEDSSATGVGRDERNNDAQDSGAVYVFRRSATGWGQEAYLKASNTDTEDNLGWSVALSSDGATLAVGAFQEDSSATGVGRDERSNDAQDSGAAYVFRRTGSTWAQEAYVKASNTEGYDAFGVAVALSSDGATLVVGAQWEDSSATGIDGDQASNALMDSGAAYVFRRTAAGWEQTAYVKASTIGLLDSFGWPVAISSDGATFAVGALYEDSASRGIDGDQANNGTENSGAVYVFRTTP